MKKYKATFLFIVLFLCVFGCCKQISCPDFTKEDLAWIPYKNVDTLVFKNFDNDSIISLRTFFNQGTGVVRDRNKWCSQGCYSFAQVSMSSLLTENNFNFYYYVHKYNDSTLVFANAFNPVKQLSTLWFDLNRSFHNDSLLIAGNWIHDVYEYSITDSYPPLIKLFVKNGNGIVKFILKNNQSFEIIKMNKNE
jgi:hypothetical protein